MEMKFDPLVPAERAAIQTMLAALSAQGVGVSDTLTGELRGMTTPPARQITDAPTAQQCDSMDDTGGIHQTPEAIHLTGAKPSDPPLAVGAPSTAAATASPSAPEVPPVGDLGQKFESALPAATASVPAVPTAPAATASPAPVGDLDSAGLPWDERIHAGSKARIADGTWRQRRNLPDGLREQVEAELRGNAGTAAEAGTTIAAAPPAPTAVPVTSTIANLAAPGVSTAAPTSDTTAAPAVSAPPLPPAVPAVPAIPPVPSLPAIPTSTPAVAAPAPAAATGSGQPRVADGDFVALFQKSAALMAENMINQADIDRICESVGLPASNGFMLLPTRPDLVAQIDAAIEELFE